jgi:hypothetical protein
MVSLARRGTSRRPCVQRQASCCERSSGRSRSAALARAPRCCCWRRCRQPCDKVRRHRRADLERRAFRRVARHFPAGMSNPEVPRAWWLRSANGPSSSGKIVCDGHRFNPRLGPPRRKGNRRVCQSLCSVARPPTTSLSFLPNSERGLYAGPEYANRSAISCATMLAEPISLKIVNPFSN